MKKANDRPGSKLPKRNISVAMATFNGARYLEAQLESLQSQQVTPCELVVTDDGSTDGTLAILNEFAKTAPFSVEIFRNNVNLGYADNFFKAASLCRGEIIAFCDQDDFWLENKVAVCLQEFEDPEVLLCVHSAALWDGKVRSGGRCPDYPRRQSFPALTANPLQSSYGFAMVFRKELLSITDNRNRIRSVDTDRPMAHDQWIWFLGLIFGKTVLLEDALVLYRQHGGNLFGSPTEQESHPAPKIQPKVTGPVSELRCAEYLDHLALLCAEQWRPKALAGAEFMRRAATCNALRSAARDISLPLSKRWKAFARMCLQGQYGNPMTRSGRCGQAAKRSILRPIAKDLVTGLLRPHRFVTGKQIVN